MLSYKSLTTITLTGSAQQVTTQPIYVKSVIFQCPSGNAGSTSVDCNSSISTSNGAVVAAGKEIALGGSDLHGHTETFDLSTFYVKGTNTDTIRISYVEKVS